MDDNIVTVRKRGRPPIAGGPTSGRIRNRQYRRKLKDKTQDAFESVGLMLGQMILASPMGTPPYLFSPNLRHETLKALLERDTFIPARYEAELREAMQRNNNHAAVAIHWLQKQLENEARVKAEDELLSRDNK